MNEVHYHNDGKETVYIGGRSVPPGETKLVDAALVPRKVAEASAQDQSDDAADAQPGDEPQVNQEEAAGQEDSAERDALLDDPDFGIAVP